MSINVYILSPILNDPQYEGFGLADNASVLGLRSVREDFYAWQGKSKRLARVWKPRDVIGNVRIENDYPTVGGIPAFSARAISVLDDMLESNGELLSLKTPYGTRSHWMYNVTTVFDALNVDKSIIDVDGACAIEHHEFYEAILVNAAIFRIPQNAFGVYVTQRFVDRVRECNLQGFWFQKVWPLPRGTDWGKLARDERKKQAGAVGPVRRAEVPASPTVVTSRPPAAGEERDSLEEALAGYERNLDINASLLSPDEIQSRIAIELDRIRESGLDKEDKADRAFWCAVAWGETIRKKLGWEWAMLVKAGGAKTMAVVSPDRSHAVAVFHFIEMLAVDKKREQTSELLYNLIKAGEVTVANPGDLLVLS